MEHDDNGNISGTEGDAYDNTEFAEIEDEEDDDLINDRSYMPEADDDYSDNDEDSENIAEEAQEEHLDESGPSTSNKSFSSSFTTRRLTSQPFQKLN